MINKESVLWLYWPSEVCQSTRLPHSAAAPAVPVSPVAAPPVAAPPVAAPPVAAPPVAAPPVAAPLVAVPAAGPESVQPAHAPAAGSESARAGPPGTPGSPEWPSEYTSHYERGSGAAGAGWRRDSTFQSFKQYKFGSTSKH